MLKLSIWFQLHLGLLKVSSKFSHIKKLFLDLSMLNPYCILFYGQLRHNCVISLSRKCLQPLHPFFFVVVINLEIEETVRGQIKMVMDSWSGEFAGG